MKSRKTEWYVARPFRFAGRSYQVRDPFHWREVGCTERRLQQLVDRRSLVLFENLPPAKAKSEEEEPATADSGE